MAMHASRLQNFSVHFDGFNEMNGSIVQKNKGGGLGGRKALNDISNSGKPSALQPSRKHNAKNVIPIGEDLSVMKKGKAQVSGRKALNDISNSGKPSALQPSRKHNTKNVIPIGEMNGSIVQKNKGGGLGGRKALNDISNSGKPSALQPSRKHNAKNVIPIGEDLSVMKKGKAQVSGRKARGDLTNMVSPRKQKLKSPGKQSITVAEDEKFPEKMFVHNHDKCVEYQRKIMYTSDFNEDLLCNSDSEFSPSPRKPKDENLDRFFDIEEVEEVFELMVEDLRYDEPLSPIWRSPVSPSTPYMMGTIDDVLSSITVIDSP